MTITKKQAKSTIELAWSMVINLAATKGQQETRQYLADCLKAEKRELPVMLAKALLTRSVWSGGDRPNRNIGDLYGVRDAHVKAMMIGARFKFRAVDDQHAADLAEAAEVMFRDWQGRRSKMLEMKTEYPGEGRWRVVVENQRGETLVLAKGYSKHRMIERANRAFNEWSRFFGLEG